MQKQLLGCPECNVDLGFAWLPLLGVGALVSLPITTWLATRKLPSPVEKIKIEEVIKEKEAEIPKAFLWKVAGVSFAVVLIYAVVKDLRKKKGTK